MPLAAVHFDYLRDVVSQRSGNTVSSTQSYLLESRLTPFAERMGLQNVESLVAELRKTPASALHDKVAEAMTVNETSFFRDLQPFDVLREQLLPKLIAARTPLRRLRIWSAACSSGQEAYSLAMTIREYFPELATWTVEILATDLSDEMLERTRNGTYSQFEVNRGLPARLLARYFERTGLVWQAKAELRSLIQCRKLNLMSIGALPAFDVVFLRNVLIYFDQPRKEAILAGVHRVLATDGCLFLGGGETLINLQVPFQREMAGPAPFFRPLESRPVLA
ncbi:CheR family methyltransferase [Planctomicrobium sp. SH664]|uniref:CheR family methyltransferase n=1 Tax=Planctomicrobium sp. SH664 TaxID=3448125 RepID=UPI003F5B437A